MANNTIKAIETVYNGYRFRSRLEARWAVFFDSLNIPYIYEPEGLNINGTMYLPDFYLPDSKQFFEVKGIMRDSDMEKINALISAGYSVVIGMDNGKFIACDLWETMDENGNKDEYTLCTDSDSWMIRCKKCGKYYFMGDVGSFKCQCCGLHDGDHHLRIVMDGYDTALWDVARQARFEYGETP